MEGVVGQPLARGGHFFTYLLRAAWLGLFGTFSTASLPFYEYEPQKYEKYGGDGVTLDDWLKNIAVRFERQVPRDGGGLN